MDDQVRAATLALLKRWGGKIFIAYAAVCGILAVFPSMADEQFLASFCLWFLANIVYLPALLAPAGIGVWVGMKVRSLSGLGWAGWIVGTVLYVALAMAVIHLLVKIPYLDWRFVIMTGYR